MGVLDDLLAKFEMQQAQANAANEQRYQQGLDLYEQNIQQFMPGGSFGAGMEAQLERAATKSVAQSQQSLVSSGLANTTTAANTRTKWEEEVGTPARLQMEDYKAQQLASARSAKAGFIERREDTGPSAELIASLAKAAGTATSNAGRTQRGFSVSDKGYSRLTAGAKAKAVKTNGGFFIPY